MTGFSLKFEASAKYCFFTFSSHNALMVILYELFVWCLGGQR